ncbi:CBO0543 family protein [Paenibacillus cremeus]|uniref:CBO0543 family protein n=1 Tax=Paenibacillus cremeus TaxID=2163881 RepID=UPI003703CE09
MVIIIFTLSFLTVFLLTKSYRYFPIYYSTIQYVSMVAFVYPLICRGYMVWSFPAWGLFTDKANELLQATVLFPSTTVLFFRYLPHRLWTRALYFLGFVGLYAGMECLLITRKEILYQHGWRFGWSVFIDFCLFALMWIHAKSWKVAYPISLCILIFLVVLFQVPIDG